MYRVAEKRHVGGGHKRQPPRGTDTLELGDNRPDDGRRASLAARYAVYQTAPERTGSGDKTLTAGRRAVAIMDATIQVFAYDEPPAKLERTLRRLVGQTIPVWVEATIECWVTPTGAADPSLEAVGRVEGVDLHTAPEGKLSARNAAHDAAADREVDVIVTWDADAPPLDMETVDRLLREIHHPHTVAANAAPVARETPDGDFSVAGAVIDAGAVFEDVLSPHMHGQASAITREGWDAAGPFDTSIDETDPRAVRAEEELNFYHRLRRHGRVAFSRARVYNDPRRHLSRLPVGGGYERERAETFSRLFGR